MTNLQQKSKAWRCFVIKLNMPVNKITSKVSFSKNGLGGYLRSILLCIVNGTKIGSTTKDILDLEVKSWTLFCHQQNSTSC